jgi:hypothetical protein
VRPWLLRALVMTLLYGVGQTLFVVLSSRFVDQTLWWTVLLLGVLLLVGLFWGGTEVITDRIPPEWTWFKAALLTGPAAGLLTWALLALFVDAVGVSDLGSALVGRASFTVLVVLGSVALGSRFGWISLRRSGDPRAEDDPGADADEPVLRAPSRTTTAGAAGDGPALPASTAERVAARRARRLQEREAAASGSGPGAPTGPDDEARVPFGAGPFADLPASAASSGAANPRGYASPMVAVLPEVTPLSPDPEQATDEHAPDDERPSTARRRFGLRRPGADESG